VELSADNAVTIYEVEPNSWMRVPEEQNRPLTEAEIGPLLLAYARKLGFTHIAILPRSDRYKNLHLYLRENGLGAFVVDQFVSSTWNSLQTGQLIEFFEEDAIHRKFSHDKIASLVPDSARPVAALSHEQVANGKASLLSRMSGDRWQKFANLRLLFACVFLQPGKKLLFMGNEFAQWQSWNPEQSLDWHLLENDSHLGIQRWVAHLNHLYRSESAAQNDVLDRGGFQWIDREDRDQSVVSWLRQSSPDGEWLAVILNCTPIPRHNYRVGVPLGGVWKEMLNSDAEMYGGSGVGNFGAVEAAPFECHGHPYTLTLTLPPLGALVFKGGSPP
jgi:1,4-alpha-glucan branching enzyme